MQSEFLKLNWFDIGKGLVVAIITGVLTTIMNMITNNNPIQYHEVINIAITAGISYILKQLVTNDKGEILNK